MWSGPRPREELPAIYAGADAVLFPVTWPEPWGLVPLEAMGIGRPVVATARGGSGEYLRDGVNCLTVRPAEPAGIARAVRRLAGDQALRERLRAGGVETARRHTAGQFNASVERALKAAVASADVPPHHAA